MTKIKSILISSVISLSLIGCNKTSNSDGTDENNNIVKNKNGYSQSRLINGIKINLTYKPSKLVLNQMVSNQKLNSSQFDSIENKCNKLIYFILSYSKNNNEILSTIPSSRQQFNEIQNTLTFKMNEHVCLTNNKNDTIPFMDYNFPRTYGMSKTTNLLFVFQRSNIKNNSLEFNFNLADIGLGIGDIKFAYPSEIINKTSI